MTLGSSLVILQIQWQTYPTIAVIKTAGVFELRQRS